MPLTDSITATYSYDVAGRLSTVSAGTPCSSGTCSPFATTTLYTANNYAAAGILAASYGDGLSLTRFYDNRMRVMDNEIVPTTDTFGWATLTLTGSEQPGDSGKVSVTVGGNTMSTPYGASSTPSSIAQALVGVINQTWQSPVSASLNSPTVIRLTALEAGSGDNSSITAIATDAGTSSPSFTATVNGTVLQGGTGTVAYYYKLGYDAVGNIIQTSDQSNGWWQYRYDTLNRLTSGFSNGATYPYLCWSYDDFGNRNFELDQTSANHGACPAANAPLPSGFAQPAGSQLQSSSYLANNQVQAYSINGSAQLAFAYDAAGDVIDDGSNLYVYDSEGRICAVKSSGPTYTQYIYDAEGRRVARGSISQLPASGNTCAAPTTKNGFILQAQYLRGSAGNQDTELDGSGNWVHSNIFSGAGLTATYWKNGGTNTLSYNFNDWLGTKRMQATSTSPSMLEAYSTSYPYGNFLSLSGNGGDATEHHYTGKERDAESGNDYFGARYYASSMGRWMSPDRINVTEDRMMNPSSTLNKYAYGADNPLKYVDPDGQDITIYYEAGNPLPGHTMLLAYNQQTGDSATRSFGPDHSTANQAETLIGAPVPGTDTFGFENIKSPDDLRNNFTSITIQTTPEEAQAVIDAIRAHPDGNYTTYWNNCTTTCSRLLRSIGKTSSHALTPGKFFEDLWNQQHPNQMKLPNFANGRDYGSPRYDPFQMFFWLMGSNDKSSVTTTSTNCVTDSNGQKQCDTQ